MSIEKEKLIHRAPAFEGRMLHVFDDEVEIHGHKTTREVVLHPGASAIIPVTEEGEILFVRQYRYAVEQPLLESVGALTKVMRKAHQLAVRFLRER